jgi:hypothetical protein
MRKGIVAVLVLFVLFLGWSAWPFMGLYDLARAAQSGDVARVEQRVDFPALGRSLSGQIVQTYSRLAGVPVAPGGLLAGIASAIADPIVARLITRVALGQLLQTGWPQEVLGDRPPDVPSLNWSALGNVGQLYASAESGLGEFRIWLPVDQPRARQFRVRLALRGLTWKLTGIDLPQELQERLARELIKQQGKSG